MSFVLSVRYQQVRQHMCEDIIDCGCGPRCRRNSTRPDVQCPMLPSCNHQDRQQRKGKLSSALQCCNLAMSVRTTNCTLSDISVILEAKHMVEPIALILVKCVQRDRRSQNKGTTKAKTANHTVHQSSCACNLAPPLWHGRRQDREQPSIDWRR